jgi:hypothetical protein
MVEKLEKDTKQQQKPIVGARVNLT